MKIKLDENMPATLAEVLRNPGHDADTARDEGLNGSPGQEIWRATQDAGRFLITQDLDFSDMRTFAPGSHLGILLLRLAHGSQRELIGPVRSLFEAEEVESWGGCFIVATESKIRVKRPVPLKE